MGRETWERPGRPRKERAPAPPNSELQQAGELSSKLEKVHTAEPLDSLSVSWLPLESNPVQVHMANLLVLRMKLEAECLVGCGGSLQHCICRHWRPVTQWTHPNRLALGCPQHSAHLRFACEAATHEES